MSAPAPVICAVYDSGHVCTKALNHVGEHATITVSGVTRHRWTQSTPGDAVKDAAPASSGAPSLVELDAGGQRLHEAGGALVSAEFKKGDKVTVREGAVSLHGHRRDPEEVRTVHGPARSAANAVLLEPIPGTGGGNIFFASDLAHAEDHGTGDGSVSDICAEPGCNCDLERRFPAPLDPAKVKPGDTVTLERDGGRLPDQEVVVVTSTEQGWIILILKGAVEVRVTGPDPWLITDHQPAPEPEPYTPGSESVRRAYVDARMDADIIGEEEAGAEFDRWMAALVAIDPADVDVKSVGAALSEAVREPGAFLTWDGIARTVLAEVGIEVPR